jgi:hypothetical protein
MAPQSAIKVARNRKQPSVAGWSSSVARQAHNLKVVGSNPTPATKKDKYNKYLNPDRFTCV